MKDLNNIPERYHILFTSDWNGGNESEMKSVQRSLMNELYLDYMRWDMSIRVQSNKLDSILTEEMIEKEKM